MSNKIQSIVNAGPCRELGTIMQDNIFMFADTIKGVSMFPYNEARVFCLSGDVYRITQTNNALLFVNKIHIESDNGDQDYW
tara:strand:+ start:1836 stop:2078 length:243 start_codon:yes stop_codon:yes gene_type:complete